MKRTLLVALSAALIAGFGAGALAGGLESIEKRKGLMKTVGGSVKLGSGMVKGETTWDAVKAAEAMTAIATAATEFPTHFPDDSKEGGETTAAPAIWESKADFDALSKKLADDATAAAAAAGKDQQAFNAAFGEMTKGCGGCHEKFRVKK